MKSSSNYVDTIVAIVLASIDLAGMCNPEEYFLWLPNGMEYTLQKKKKHVKQVKKANNNIIFMFMLRLLFGVYSMLAIGVLPTTLFNLTL